MDWDWRPSLEGAVFGYEKGQPDPHIIPPELWQTISAKRKKEAIREYERDPAAATVAAVATFIPDGAVSTQVAPSTTGPTYTDDSDVPRLPREFESSVPEPHRDKNAWHPPGCIARKLSKKEMTSCPRARKALDAEWEKLRFLKRPHPTKGVGAWDEGNVREASSVREEARQAGKTVHFGRTAELCHEKKGASWPTATPERR